MQQQTKQGKGHIQEIVSLRVLVLFFFFLPHIELANSSLLKARYRRDLPVHYHLRYLFVRSRLT